jgi:hypothetical protein
MPEVHETVQELVRVVSKVVLLHLPLLQQMPTFGALWQKVLELLIHATSTHNEALVEAVPEALKNMLLVMHAKVRSFPPPPRCGGPHHLGPSKHVNRPPALPHSSQQPVVVVSHCDQESGWHVTDGSSDALG